MSSSMEIYVIALGVTLGSQLAEYLKSAESLKSSVLALLVIMLIFLADTGHGYSIEGLLTVVYASIFAGGLGRFFLPTQIRLSGALGTLVLVIYAVATAHALTIHEGSVVAISFGWKLTLAPIMAVAVVLLASRIDPAAAGKQPIVLGMAVLFLTLCIQLVPFYYGLFMELGSDRLGVRSSAAWGMLVCVVAACLSAYAGAIPGHSKRSVNSTYFIWCGAISFLTNIAWSTVFSFRTTMATISPHGGSVAILDHSYWVHACLFLAISGFVVGSLASRLER